MAQLSKNNKLLDIVQAYLSQSQTVNEVVSLATTLHTLIPPHPVNYSLIFRCNTCLFG